MKNILYYTSHSLMSNPAKYSYLFDSLPDDVVELCKIVQGIMLLDGDAHLYDYVIPQHRLRELELRDVSKMLSRIVEINDSSLEIERHTEDKLIGSCRDFSLILCAMLRHKNIPSRVRVGFVSHKSYYSEHAITEYWNEKSKQWMLVDPIRNIQNIAKHKVSYDVFNVPRDVFITAGLAWNKYRVDGEDPTKFGVGFISGYRGWWYIRNKLIQDLCALNKVEVLPWDHWSFMNDFELGDSLSDDEKLNLFDCISRVTNISSPEIHKVISLFENNLITPPVSLNSNYLSEHRIDRIVSRWSLAS